MAIASGRFTAKPDGTMDGVFATGPPQRPAHRHAERGQDADAAPDLRGVNKRTSFEIGAGWASVSQRSGKETTKFKLEAPGFGVIFGNLAPAPGGEEGKTVILWNNPE